MTESVRRCLSWAGRSQSPTLTVWRYMYRTSGMVTSTYNQMGEEGTFARYSPAQEVAFVPVASVSETWLKRA